MRPFRLAAVPLTVIIMIVSLATPAEAAPSVITVHARAAVAYATKHHVTSSIAVIDTANGRTYAAGSRDRHYAAASTAKVFTAVMILARHKMTTKKNRADMWAMITKSDNSAWSRLQAQIGRGHAITSVEKRYKVHIGTEPAIIGNSGESLVTALGMARMYAAIKKDKRVWPWLSDAMAHISRHAAGGTDQFFGIPAAHPHGGFALKQGWLRDKLKGREFSVMHSTGYVDKDRYVVCIYTEGAAPMYSGIAKGPQGRTISGEARLLLPDGRMR